MGLSDFVYRQVQRWKYHTADNSFEKKVAVVNRNQPLISVGALAFTIKGCELTFSNQHHSFIVERFALFRRLLKSGKFEIKGNDLFYHGDAIIVRITTAEELFILNEVFFEGCYTVITRGNFNVIDIGMNVGFASLFYASHASVNHVYSYEPFKNTFNDAQVNLALNPNLSRKITPHPFGLSRQSDVRTVYYSPDLKGKNSIYTENTGSGAGKIELKNAFEVINEVINKDTDREYFVKMDCEGAEFEIFESLAQGGIPRQIFGFIIEWHQRDPQPIVDVLIASNFKVQKRGNMKIGLITAFR